MDIKPLLALCTKKNLPVGVLLFMVLLSGFSVSYTAFENRRLHNQLQQELENRNRAQVEWGRLLIEHSTLTSPGRVERIARKKLDMDVPPSDKIEMVVQ